MIGLFAILACLGATLAPKQEEPAEVVAIYQVPEWRRKVTILKSYRNGSSIAIQELVNPPVIGVTFLCQHGPWTVEGPDAASILKQGLRLGDPAVIYTRAFCRMKPKREPTFQERCFVRHSLTK